MSVKQNKLRLDNKKEDYNITLSNSDSLDKDEKNIKQHVKKILLIYHKNLLRNIKPLNFDKITVIIEHRNGIKEKFKFTEKEIQELSKHSK